LFGEIPGCWWFGFRRVRRERIKKTISPARRAPITAQPIPIPAAAPADTFELFEPFNEGELVAGPADAVDVLVESVPVLVAIVDEVAEGVEALAELDERLRGLNLQTVFEQVDS
jgi:hypothetical protein